MTTAPLVRPTHHCHIVEAGTEDAPRESKRMGGMDGRTISHTDWSCETRVNFRC